MDILLGVVEEQDATLVVVTHDSRLSTLGDRVFTIQDGKIAREETMDDKMAQN